VFFQLLQPIVQCRRLASEHFRVPIRHDVSIAFDAFDYLSHRVQRLGVDAGQRYFAGAIAAWTGVVVGHWD
jgi:hypothetical protein